MLLFKRILDFKKADAASADKRGAKRYPVGARFPLKAKLSLPARDSEGALLSGERASSTDWGGQMIDLSASGASIRLHPAAVTAQGDACLLMLELDHMLFEIAARVAHFRAGAQYVTCGLGLDFPDAYARKAYLQLMEPVVVGSSLEAVEKVKPDHSGLPKEQYTGESDSVLSVWRDESGRNPKHFELQVREYFVRGSTDQPELGIGYRDGAKVGRRVSSPSFPVAMSAEHQAEVRQLFQYVVQNLAKAVPADIRKLLELVSA